MYCPRCAARIEGTKFCRSCGANVSLVPQALTGELQPETEEGRRSHRKDKTPSMERAAGNVFTGIGFIFVALAVWRFFPGGFVWWFWLLIPAFSMIGSGIGQYLKVREIERKREQYLASPPSSQHSAQSMPGYTPPLATPTHDDQASLSAPTTSDLKGPGSIIEHTTRHLESNKKESE